MDSYVFFVFGVDDANYVFVEKIMGIQKQVQKNIVTNHSF